jgi:hypothetical protein
VVPLPPSDIDPIIETWSAGRSIVRCHGRKYHERQFNPTASSARFRPLLVGGAVVPTIYGAEDLWGAASETVFHEVPVRGPNRRILRSSIERWHWSEVAPVRDLRLASLHGVGLKRVEVTHGELIEVDAAHYAETIPWTEALYNVSAAPDGLCWRSRQHNDSLAVMLFGTRVREADLEVVRPAASLALSPGGDHVFAFAEASGITIIN